MLKETVDYMRVQLEERKELIRQIEMAGGKVDDGMRR